MKPTLYDLSKIIIEDVSGSEIDLYLSDKTEFARIDFGERTRVTIPKPLTLHKKYFFEGNVFDSYDKYRISIWNLYVATLHHVGAHLQVSHYTEYKKWMKDKTAKSCHNVIHFLEDIKAENYLKKYHKNAWKNISVIQDAYDKYHETHFPKYAKSTQECFAKYFGIDGSKESWRQRFKSEFSKVSHYPIDEITNILDFLYKNQQLLPVKQYPYQDRHFYEQYQKDTENLYIPETAELLDTVTDLDNCWIGELPREKKHLERYQRYAENTNFDKVEISPENFAEFLRISNENASDLKRLTSTLRTISFFVDSPAYDEVGLIDMHAAIQRVSSQAEEIEMFEQDIPRKESENWVVLFDTSSSMKLKFDEMKKFLLCLGETAERINRDGGKWGLYSFNNKFLIVKEHREQYNQKVKARIGGMKSEGLSFIADGIEMGTQILKHDHKSLHKYMIIVSDGKSGGYESTDKEVMRALENAKKFGIHLIGIGIPDYMKKPFSFAIDYTTMKRSVKKFIDSYSLLVQQQS